MSEVIVKGRSFGEPNQWSATVEMPNGRIHGVRTDGDGVTNKKIAEVLRDLANWIEDYHPSL